MSKDPSTIIGFRVSRELKERFDAWLDERGASATNVLKAFVEALIEGDEIDTETRSKIQAIADQFGISFQEAASFAARFARYQALKDLDAD